MRSMREGMNGFVDPKIHPQDAFYSRSALRTKNGTYVVKDGARPALEVLSASGTNISESDVRRLIEYRIRGKAETHHMPESVLVDILKRKGWIFRKKGGVESSPLVDVEEYDHEETPDERQDLKSKKKLSFEEAYEFNEERIRFAYELYGEGFLESLETIDIASLSLGVDFEKIPEENRELVEKISESILFQIASKRDMLLQRGRELSRSFQNQKGNDARSLIQKERVVFQMRDLSHALDPELLDPKWMEDVFSYENEVLADVISGIPRSQEKFDETVLEEYTDLEKKFHEENDPASKWVLLQNLRQKMHAIALLLGVNNYDLLGCDLNRLLVLESKQEKDSVSDSSSKKRKGSSKEKKSVSEDGLDTPKKKTQRRGRRPALDDSIGIFEARTSSGEVGNFFSLFDAVAEEKFFPALNVADSVNEIDQLLARELSLDGFPVLVGIDSDPRLRHTFDELTSSEKDEVRKKLRVKNFEFEAVALGKRFECALGEAFQYWKNEIQNANKKTLKKIGHIYGEKSVRVFIPLDRRDESESFRSLRETYGRIEAFCVRAPKGFDSFSKLWKEQFQPRILSSNKELRALWREREKELFPRDIVHGESERVEEAEGSQLELLKKKAIVLNSARRLLETQIEIVRQAYAGKGLDLIQLGKDDPSRVQKVIDKMVSVGRENVRKSFDDVGILVDADALDQAESFLRDVVEKVIREGKDVRELFDESSTMLFLEAKE